MLQRIAGSDPKCFLPQGPSGWYLTEESILLLSGGVGCAILGHAQGDQHRGYAGGSGALAVDRRGSQQPAEARMAGADRPVERRRPRHDGDHARGRQRQDRGVALAGALYAGGSGGSDPGQDPAPAPGAVARRNRRSGD